MTEAAVLPISLYTSAASPQPWLIGLLCTTIMHAVIVPAIADPGWESDHFQPRTVLTSVIFCGYSESFPPAGDSIGEPQAASLNPGDEIPELLPKDTAGGEDQDSINRTTWMVSPDTVIFRTSAGGALAYDIPDNSKCLKAPKSPFDARDALSSGNFGAIEGTATNSSGPPEIFAEGVWSMLNSQTVKASGSAAPMYPNLADLSEGTYPVVGGAAASGSGSSWQAVSAWAIVVLTLTLLTMVGITFRVRRTAITRPGT